MEKFLKFFAVALVIFTAVACEKNEVLPNENFEKNSVTLTAFVADEETKTSFVKNGGSYMTYWSTDDKIAVIQDGVIYEFTLEEGAGSNRGTFRGNNVREFDITKQFIAFYPFESVQIVEGRIKYIPSATDNRRVFAEEGLGDQVLPIAAIVKNYSNSFNFVNMYAILKLNVKGALEEAVTSIHIGSNSIRLYGEATLNTETGTPQLSRKNDSYPTNIVLDCQEGVGIGGDGKSFFIALPPTGNELSKYGILINTTEGSYYMPTASGNFFAGNIVSLDVDLESGSPKSRAALSVGYSEDGTNYGNGVLIGKTLWAPVNCGYKPEEGSNKGYPYGKLYQWGRKYGNGYDNTDASFPTANTTNPPSASSQSPGDDFYTYWGTLFESNQYNYNDYRTAWNDATKKFNNVPCPEGWEVPTLDDARALCNGNKSGFTEKDDQKGYWFSGDKEFVQEKLDDSVFFPAAGQLGQEWSNYKAKGRGTIGCYWTSSYNGYASTLNFDSNQVRVSTDYGTVYYGNSVRCVKSRKWTSTLE